MKVTLSLESHHNLDAINIVFFLNSQRAQRKALDVLNTVGLSNSVLRLIERRNRVDTWIKYMGMIATIVVLYLFIRWTR